MGQFSVEIYALPGSLLSGNQQPTPEAYLRTAEILGMRPDEVCLVAAHNSDLLAARNCGFRTACVPRITEHGPKQTSDLSAEQDWDFVAKDLEAFADVLDT